MILKHEIEPLNRLNVADPHVRKTSISIEIGPYGKFFPGTESFSRLNRPIGDNVPGTESFSRLKPEIYLAIKPIRGHESFSRLNRPIWDNVPGPESFSRLIRPIWDNVLSQGQSLSVGSNQKFI